MGLSPTSVMLMTCPDVPLAVEGDEKIPILNVTLTLERDLVSGKCMLKNYPFPSPMCTFNTTCVCGHDRCQETVVPNANRV